MDDKTATARRLSGLRYLRRQDPRPSDEPNREIASAEKADEEKMTLPIWLDISCPTGRAFREAVRYPQV